MITNNILKPFTSEEELNNQIHDCYLPISANHENRAKYRPGPKNVVFANYYYAAMDNFYIGDYITGIKDLMYCLNMHLFESLYDMYYMYTYMEKDGIDAADPIKVI